MFKCKTRTYFKFDKLGILISRVDPSQMVSIISDDLYIHCSVLTLRTDLRFLLKLEVQVFNERPYTFYL